MIRTSLLAPLLLWTVSLGALGCGATATLPPTPPPPSAAGDDATENDADQNGADQNGGDQNGADQNGAGENESRSESDASDSTVGDTLAETPIQLRTLPEDELREGWISLFDGQSLFGWRATSKADWKVEDGTIVVTSGEKGLLCTAAQFDRYVLKLEFRSAAETNSGVFLNTPQKPTDPASDCYELNIAPADNPFPTGSLVKRQKVEGEYQSTDWQAYEVRVDGGHVHVKLNGEQVLDYTDPAPLGRGHIGLQLNSGRVAFRNIKLKPLGVKPLFNGKDLTGWKQYPEMASKFSVGEAGDLRVEDGRGQLETEQAYGDFVLQLECITHAPGLNSGIFFRCIPGDVMMGYEAQIHNGFKNDDRAQPVDWGTGAIFRRQPARLVAADDQEWFSMTLIVHGPHMAAWVNGFPVCVWSDPRPPHENPRKGLRLEAGTLMIQGHDPTTNISFRNLRANELLPVGKP